jgi:hypothetical protein
VASIGRTELEFTRRRAMRAIVRAFVVGTLGLAVVVGMTTDGTAVEIKAVTCKCRNIATNRPPEEVYIRGKNCQRMNGTQYIRKDGIMGRLVMCVEAKPVLPGGVKPPDGGTLQK